MDTGSIAALASGMAQERTANAVSMAVFKKALDAQGSMTLALIDSVSQPSAAQSLPPHLGNHINVKA